MKIKSSVLTLFYVHFYCVQLLFKWLGPMTGCYWTHGMGWREEAEVEGEWQRKPPDCDILTTAECHTAVISDTSMVPCKLTVIWGQGKIEIHNISHCTALDIYIFIFFLSFWLLFYKNLFVGVSDWP